MKPDPANLSLALTGGLCVLQAYASEIPTIALIYSSGGFFTMGLIFFQVDDQTVTPWLALLLVSIALVGAGHWCLANYGGTYWIFAWIASVFVLLALVGYGVTIRNLFRKS
jgi:hypothetical protein